MRAQRGVEQRAGYDAGEDAPERGHARSQFAFRLDLFHGVNGFRKLQIERGSL